MNEAVVMSMQNISKSWRNVSMSDTTSYQVYNLSANTPNRGLYADEHGTVWVSNWKCIYRYGPAENNFRSFCPEVQDQSLIYFYGKLGNKLMVSLGLNIVLFDRQTWGTSVLINFKSEKYSISLTPNSVFIDNENQLWIGTGGVWYQKIQPQ